MKIKNLSYESNEYVLVSHVFVDSIRETIQLFILLNNKWVKFIFKI